MYMIGDEVVHNGQTYVSLINYNDCALDNYLAWRIKKKDWRIKKEERNCGANMRLIYAEKLKQHYAWWEGGTEEHTLDEMKKIFDTIINVQPTILEGPIVGMTDRDIEWHKTHKAMGFSDPIADLYEELEALIGERQDDGERQTDTGSEDGTGEGVQEDC